MARFMFLQRGGCEKPPEMTPEQMQQEMQMWMDWMKGGTEAGWILDPGSPLSSTGAVVHPDSTVIDGPFAESKELIGGYMIVEATDLNSAIELVKGSPMIKSGSTIEVRELPQMGMPDA